MHALAALVTVATAVGGAQQPAPAVDTSKLGPQVGATVPPFSGVDQFGTPQSLASLSGPKGLMLVFSRSAATAIIKRYGLFKATVDAQTRAFGIPHYASTSTPKPSATRFTNAK